MFIYQAHQVVVSRTPVDVLQLGGLVHDRDLGMCPVRTWRKTHKGMVHIRGLEGWAELVHDGGIARPLSHTAINTVHTVYIYSKRHHSLLAVNNREQ